MNIKDKIMSSIDKMLKFNGLTFCITNKLITFKINNISMSII